MIEKIYTHKKKGGRYRILFLSVGAGISRGQSLVIYQYIKSGAIHPLT